MTYFIICVNYLSTRIELRHERATVVVCWRFTRHAIGGKQDNNVTGKLELNFFSLENPIFCSQQRVSNAFEMLANQLMLCLIFQQETSRLNLFEFDMLTDRPTGFVYYKNHIT